MLLLVLLIKLCFGAGRKGVEKRPDGSGHFRGRVIRGQALPSAYQYPGTGPYWANGLVELIVLGAAV